MIEHTVVGWNDTAASEAALNWALGRAGSQRSSLSVLDIVDRGLFLGDDGALERATANAEKRLEARVAEIARTHPDAVSDSDLVVGDPLSFLAAQTQPDTLVVVGTARRLGPRVRYGSSLGPRLATIADGPVAIVPVEDAEAAQARSGVVVGVDGSEAARLALELGADEASRMEQTLLVVHCWQEPLAGERLVVPDEEFVHSQQAAHQELLDAQVRAVREAHPQLRVESTLLRQNPISALRASSERSRMLVVGSRQLTGWKRTWLGSVSHGLILDLAAPTVVVGAEVPQAA